MRTDGLDFTADAPGGPARVGRPVRSGARVIQYFVDSSWLGDFTCSLADREPTTAPEPLGSRSVLRATRMSLTKVSRRRKRLFPRRREPVTLKCIEKSGIPESDPWFLSIVAA